MLASVLHIGWVAEFLSKPIVTGFVLGPDDPGDHR